MIKHFIISLFLLCSFAGKSQPTFQEGHLVLCNDSVFWILNSVAYPLAKTKLIHEVFIDTITKHSSPELDRYARGEVIKTWRLIKTEDYPEVFLLMNKQRHHIINVPAFQYYQFDWAKIKVVSTKQLQKMKEGPRIFMPILPKKPEEKEPVLEPLPCGVRDSDH